MNEHQLTHPPTLAARLSAAALTTLLAFTLPWLFTITIGRKGMVDGLYSYDSPVQELRRLAKDLATFAANNNRYPKSLEELGRWVQHETDEVVFHGAGAERMPASNVGEGKILLRGRGKEKIQYEATERSYRVYYVGRDGAIGGLDLVGDLDRNPGGTVHRGTTLHEFFYESPPRDLRFYFWATVIWGIVTGFACFYVTRSPRLQGRAALSLLAIGMALPATVIPGLLLDIRAILEH
jgi:hypothetical protein